VLHVFFFVRRPGLFLTFTLYDQAEKVAVNYTLHRPVGLVSVGVLRGKNIRSPELGLPGNVGCRVYWDPTRYATEKRKKAVVALDKSAAATHDIGSTNFLYAMNPVWNQMIESAAAKRLQLLLPNGGDFFETTQREIHKEAIDFPILQPFKESNGLPALVPWTSSCGALVVEVKFQDALNILPGSDYAVGEVSIPFSKLAEASDLEGWFHVLDIGSTRVPPDSTQAGNQGASSDSGAHKAKEASTDLAIDESPQIFLRIKWTAPEHSDEQIDNELNLESQREASFVIQEEMVRSAVMSQQQKFDVVVSSIGAINRVRGLSGNLLLVQNTLGLILDTFEAFRNAFNFSVSGLRLSTFCMRSLSCFALRIHLFVTGSLQVFRLICSAGRHMVVPCIGTYPRNRFDGRIGKSLRKGYCATDRIMPAVLWSILTLAFLFLGSVWIYVLCKIRALKRK
jgi:hypothetical protein